MKKIYLIITALILITLLGSSANHLDLINLNDIQALAQGSSVKKDPHDISKLSKWLKVLKQRPALSVKDKAAKDKIVGRFAKEKYKSGYPMVTKDYKIEYVGNADEFFVEITSPDTQKAKYWATMWFKLNGFTEEGMCRLPVAFYLSLPIAQQLEGMNIEFNPLPDQCK